MTTTATTTGSSPTPVTDERPALATVLRQFAARQYLVGVLVVLCVAVGLARPSFWGAGNVSNVLFQASFVGLAACGMTLLIASGLLDLSVGGTIAVASIAVAKVLP